MDAGINVGIGTDGSCSNNSLDMCVVFRRFHAVFLISYACLGSSKLLHFFKSCAPTTPPPLTPTRYLSPTCLSLLLTFKPIFSYAFAPRIVNRSRLYFSHEAIVLVRPFFNSPPAQIVRCATLNGAQAVKVNAGAVEVGRLADLIAIDCRYVLVVTILVIVDVVVVVA